MRLPGAFICFILWTSVCLGQSKHIGFIKADVLKKNKVYKCVEYDYSDSISFFKEYKNGFYTIFDPDGRKIEENLFPGLGHESKVLYMYNSSGWELLWIWIDEMMAPTIQRVYVNTFNSSGRKIGYIDYLPNYMPETGTLTNTNAVHDSVVSFKGSDKKVTHLYFRDNKRADTSSIFCEYYHNERLDSAVLKDSNELLRSEFLYASNILILSTHRWIDKNRLTQIEKIYYLKNGLIDYYDESYYELGDTNTINARNKHMKCSYSYWQ